MTNEEKINSLTDEQLLAMASQMDIPSGTSDQDKINAVREMLKGFAALGNVPGFNVEMETHECCGCCGGNCHCHDED